MSQETCAGHKDLAKSVAAIEKKQIENSGILKSIEGNTARLCTILDGKNGNPGLCEKVRDNTKEISDYLVDFDARQKRTERLRDSMFLTVFRVVISLAITGMLSVLIAREFF